MASLESRTAAQRELGHAAVVVARVHELGARSRKQDRWFAWPRWAPRDAVGEPDGGHGEPDGSRDAIVDGASRRPTRPRWRRSLARAGREHSRTDEPRRRSRAGELVQWLIPLLAIAAWQLLSAADVIPARILPSPLEVVRAGWRLLQSGELLKNIWVSFWRAIVGLAIGGGIGFALGLATGLSRSAARLLDSTLQMVRNIPHLALIPLVILWFGIDETAKVFLVALGVFFPIYVNTQHGIRAVDPQLIEMAQIYGMPRWQRFHRVYFPGALPSIFVGLRYALGIMWLTLIVAETIAASSGIGYMAMQAREFLLVDVVVLSIVIYAVLGKLADTATRLLERRFLRWSPALSGR